MLNLWLYVLLVTVHSFLVDSHLLPFPSPLILEPACALMVGVLNQGVQLHKVMNGPDVTVVVVGNSTCSNNSRQDKSKSKVG